MRAEQSFVAIDWGTSSFRLWHLNSLGEVLAEYSNSCGMGALDSADYEPLLEEVLYKLSIDEDIPTVICGMAGAAQGWHEAPYLDTPTNLDQIASRAVRVPGGKRDIRILPGLAQRKQVAPDVMRGEETLLLGAMPKINGNTTICMPGTHSKWVRVEGGTITGFSTFMTGEVFALMSTKSILSRTIENSDTPFSDSEAYVSAVEESISSPTNLLNLMFTCRSNSLLFPDTNPTDIPARLSGLLIGSEISGMRKRTDREILLISDGELGRTYGKAFETLGMPYSLLNSQELARLGLYCAAKTIWPERFKVEGVSK